MATTFLVSDVEASVDSPKTIPLAEALVARGAEKAIASGGPTRLLAGPVINPLVLAAQVAFAEHRPLVLCPDDIWLTVLGGVAAHLAQNAESLRARWVDSAGCQKVEIRRDDLAPGSQPPGDWATVPAELCSAVLERSGPLARSLRARFSTTCSASSVALDVALLDALQSYFSYSVASLCGIPTITLLGTPEDWGGMLECLSGLEGMGLDRWLGPLRKVMAQMLRAVNGHTDRDFWSSFYKPANMSGGERVTGWINVLFPYLRDSNSREPRETQVYIPGNPHSDRADQVDWNSPKLHEFPLGLGKAPFAWRLPDETRALEMVAGHVGVGVDEGTGAVAPAFGWWIAPPAFERHFVIQRAGEAEGVTLWPRDAHSMKSLRTLAREIRGYRAVSLRLFRCEALSSLDGLEEAHVLTELRISGCAQLTTLAPLANLPKLRWLSVADCLALSDISALATLSGLEELYLLHCPCVRDLSPLKALPALRRLGLRGVPGLSPELPYPLTGSVDLGAFLSDLADPGPPDPSP